MVAGRARFEQLPEVLDWLITGAAWDAAKHLLKRVSALWRRRQRGEISTSIEDHGQLAFTFSDVVPVTITVTPLHGQDADPPVNPTL